MVRFRNFLIALSVMAFLICGTLLTPGLADGGANHRVENDHFGVSGGNINDSSRRFCCSGTLGALVTINGAKYILSNNHVLNRSDQGSAGDDISQPGLIDNNCQVPRIVGDLSAAPPLGSNVDAALALLRPGTMDSTGFIEDIGVPSSTTANATVGMSVAKSGRTTGFTTGTVGSVNTSVSVQYQRGCGGGKKFVVSYTNQVVINSSSFSAGGDSGSLIVTNNSSHNPVALLYAGSSSTTIGNPINEVLAKVGAALGGAATFGASAPIHGRGLKLGNQGMEPFIPGVGQLRELPQQASARASAVLELHRANLMFQPGVIGAGVGAASDDNLEPAIVVYVDRTSRGRPQLLSELDGIPVRVVLTDPFVAF
jgi:Peptidase family S64